MFSLSSSKKSDEDDGDDVWFVSEASSSRKLLTSVLLSTSQKFCGENLDGNIYQSKGYSPFPYTSCSHYITLGEIPYIHLQIIPRLILYDIIVNMFRILRLLINSNIEIHAQIYP
jgi:hypothetical protein